MLTNFRKWFVKSVGDSVVRWAVYALLTTAVVSSLFEWVRASVWIPLFGFLFSPSVPPFWILLVVPIVIFFGRKIRKRAGRRFEFIETQDLKWKYWSDGSVNETPYCPEHGIQLLLEESPRRSRSMGVHDYGEIGYICPVCEVDENVKHFDERTPQKIEFLHRAVESIVEAKLGRHFSPK